VSMAGAGGGSARECKDGSGGNAGWRLGVYTRMVVGWVGALESSGSRARGILRWSCVAKKQNLWVELRGAGRVSVSASLLEGLEQMAPGLRGRGLLGRVRRHLQIYNRNAIRGRVGD
jgi:hypothetical protein